MNTLSIINPSLEIGYYSMSLSNHDIIRLIRFISKIKEVVEWLSGTALGVPFNNWEIPT
jgi:hypothetical protein